VPACPATAACEAGTKLNPTTCACEVVGKCGGACTDGQGCNPSTGACEVSPGGGAIRSDLVNKEMSIGIHNNGDGPPQGAREVHLDFNWTSGGTNSIVAVAVPPGSITVDGTTTNDGEWHGVPTTTVSGFARASELLPVGRRANDAGATNITTEDFGVTEISVAAAYDGSSIYFRVEWTDPSENDVRGRWVYNGTKWVRDVAQTQLLPAGNRDPSRAVTAAEDKLLLLFNMNIPNFFGDNGGLGSGCAGLCHLEGKDGQRIATTTADAGTTFLVAGGLMHTNGPGQKVDIWDWKASRTNPLHIYDDGVIDENTRRGDGTDSDDFFLTQGNCTRKATDGARYPTVDNSATKLHYTNEYFDPTSASCSSLGPSRVPSPYASGVHAMFEDGSPRIGKEGATASKLLDGTVAPANGDTIPGYIGRTNASTSTCVRCENEAEGRWNTGKWFLEIRRSLVAPDVDDVDFTIDQK
jgi:hypothetical protein